MDESWTLSELVAEAQTRLEALPAPRNGQVRAVPDERTIRYYQTIGLLDRPAAMRGRTALYGRRHLAQVVAIKRMQSAGKSLAEIQALWATLDDTTLGRMSGVTGLASRAKAARKEFWKREPAHAEAGPAGPAPLPAPAPQPARVVPAASAASPSAPVALPVPVFTPYAGPAPVLELRLELGAGLTLSIPLPESAPVSLSPTDVRALRAAAASLVTELASRGLTAHVVGTLEEP